MKENRENMFTIFVGARRELKMCQNCSCLNKGEILYNCIHKKKKVRIILKSIWNNKILKYWKNKIVKIDLKVLLTIKKLNSLIKKKYPFMCYLQKVHLKNKNIQKLDGKVC